MSEATQRARAERAYDAIERCANNNSIVQGLSGLAGFPFTLGTDVAVVPLYYVPLWNEIRDIYETPEVIENTSLIGRRFCRGTAWLTDGRSTSPLCTMNQPSSPCSAPRPSSTSSRR